MKRLFVCVCAGLMMVPALAGVAGAVTETDPQDQSGFLDLASLTAKGAKGGAGTFTIKTHKGFACNYLKAGSRNYLKLQFDDGRDGDIDLVGEYTCTDNKLFLFLRGPDTGSNYEPVRAKRPKAKITKVTFPLDLMEFEADHMGVIAKAKDATNVDCDPACKDRIPETGSLKVY